MSICDSPSQMELHISSKDANLNAGQTRSRFGVDLLWNQLAGSNASPANGYEILVSSWSVPFTWYGMNSTNNVFTFLANSVAYAITIPLGTYSATSLASYLQTTMNAIAASESQVFTVVFDSASAKFVFTKASGTGTWALTKSQTSVASTAASPAVAGDYVTTCYRPLGFISDGTTTASSPLDGTALSANTVEILSTRVVNMMPIDRLHLEVNWPEVRSYDTRTHGHNESVAQMTPSGDWGSLLQYGGEHTTVFRCHALPSQLQVALVDGDGSEVNLNGHDWYFTITIYGLEGMTPMQNMSENKHDSTKDTARMNMRSTAYASIPTPAEDAPNRAYQGHAPAKSIQAFNGASLNPARGSNPFMSTI